MPKNRIDRTAFFPRRLVGPLFAAALLSGCAVQPLQARLDELEARIRAVDAARERDKQEIVDKLSTKLTQIVSSSKSSGSSSAKKPRKDSSDSYTAPSWLIPRVP